MRSLRESVRFVLPSMGALGLLGACTIGAGITPGLDNPSPGGKEALHTLADDPGLTAGGDGGDAGAAGTAYVSGTLSGFWGPCDTHITCSNTLVLQNNGGDDLTLTDNGAFMFPTPLSPGQGYAVTVLTQPPTKPGLNGGQTCVVSAGAGATGSQGVTDVVVHCATNYYTVGGTVSGLLAGARVSLFGFGLDPAAPGGGPPFVLETNVVTAGDGSPSQPFTFQTPWMAGSSYRVSVLRNPEAPLGQSCVFTGANTQGQVYGDVIDANITNLGLTCTPLPYLYSFETGLEGWSIASWGGLGAATQTPDFHTQGLFGLKIIALNGATWFGVAYDAPIDLSGKTHLKWDVKTDASPTTQELAIQTGDNWNWCQGGGWPWLAAGTTTTMDVDLTDLDCNALDLSQVHALYIYFTNGGGDSGRNERVYYMDNVRADDERDAEPGPSVRHRSRRPSATARAPNAAR